MKSVSKEVEDKLLFELERLKNCRLDKILTASNEEEKQLCIEIMLNFNNYVKAGKLDEAMKYLNHIKNEHNNANL